jgi:hypothetical protein
MDTELHKVTWSYQTPAQMALHQQAEEVLVSIQFHDSLYFKADVRLICQFPSVENLLRILRQVEQAGYVGCFEYVK